MHDTEVNHLPVSGFNGEIVGIISSLEFIKLFNIRQVARYRRVITKEGGRGYFFK